MAAPYPQVVLFGDSLFEACVDTQNGFSFFAALQKHCSRRYDVVNRGFSGYNTSQALEFLEKVFPMPVAGGPVLKYILILLGANDAALPQDVDTQGVPLDQYKTNLRRIVTHPHVTAHRGAKVLLVTPPPLDEIRTTELDTPKYGGTLRRTARSAAYSQAAREVAASVPGTVLVDLQRALLEVAERETPGWAEAGAGAGAGAGSGEERPALGSVESGQRGYLETLLADGLHLSGEGYRVFWELVQGQIEVGEETVGYAHPEWRLAPWLKLN